MDDSGDAFPSEDPHLSEGVAVSTSYETADVRVVAVRGEVDLHTVATLAEALHEAARTRRRVVLDASGIDFGDSSLLNLLLHVRRATDLRVAAPGRRLRGLFAITGADTVLDLRDSVADALDD